ncbi:MAG: hypothetical protein IKH19_10335 [Muribaculaceae bacterium]|nr:hypothetical protein [Muribaculaceae bacterium]
MHCSRNGLCCDECDGDWAGNKKLPIPQEMIEDDDNYSYEYPFHRVLYTFGDNSIRPLFCTTSNGKMRITIYEHDFTTLYKQFTVDLPAPRAKLDELGQYSGDFDDEGCYVYATVDLFNNDDLVELILRNRSDDDELITYIINENSEVLAEFEGDLEELIDPRITGGKVFFKVLFNCLAAYFPLCRRRVM